MPFELFDEKGNPVQLAAGAKIRLKVNDKLVEFEPGEVATMAEKAGGADERFREASDIRKEAEGAMRAQEIGRKQNPTKEEFIEYCSWIGHTPDEAEARWQAFNDPTQETAEESPPATPATPNASATPATPQSGGVNPELAREMRELKEQNRVMGERLGLLTKKAEDDSVAGIRQQLKKDLDSHPRLGTLEEGQKKSLLEDALYLTAQRVGETKQPYSSEARTWALSQVQDKMEKLGVLKDKGEEQKNLLNRLEQSGAGLGPSSTGLLSKIQAGEVPERVPSTDPDYENNLVQRMLIQGDVVVDQEEAE